MVSSSETVTTSQAGPMERQHVMSATNILHTCATDVTSPRQPLQAVAETTCRTIVVTSSTCIRAI